MIHAVFSGLKKENVLETPITCRGTANARVDTVVRHNQIVKAASIDTVPAHTIDLKANALDVDNG